MPRKKSKARERATGKKLKYAGIECKIPVMPYRYKGDIRPGWITAEAWPRAVKM